MSMPINEIFWHILLAPPHCLSLYAMSVMDPMSNAEEVGESKPMGKEDLLAWAGMMTAGKVPCDSIDCLKVPRQLAHESHVELSRQMPSSWPCAAPCGNENTVASRDADPP